MFHKYTEEVIWKPRIKCGNFEINVGFFRQKKQVALITRMPPTRKVTHPLGLISMVFFQDNGESAGTTHLRKRSGRYLPKATNYNSVVCAPRSSPGFGEKNGSEVRPSGWVCFPACCSYEHGRSLRGNARDRPTPPPTTAARLGILEVPSS